MKTQIITRSLLILLIFASLLSCKKKPADPSVVRSMKYKDCLKEGYDKLGIFYQTNSIPGFAIAVSINNETIWADGFGYSNFELKARTSPSHLFRIGQVSEVITAITTAKLQEEGKIMIDKPVAEYLPEMPKKAADFTIRQLGTHSAGIRAENISAGKGSTNIKDSLLASFIKEDLIYEPGSTVLHSELGYDLIGYLIEKNCKESFAKVVKETVLDTLKLKNTLPDNPRRIIENKSSNYDYDFICQPITAAPIDLRVKEASAGYLSSVIDLVKIGNILVQPGFLKQESISLLTTPMKLKSGQTAPYSFGLISSKDIKGRVFLGARGFVQGGCATLLIFPEDKLVISMTANIGNESLDLPVFEIADIFLKHLHPELYKEQPRENTSKQKETK